MNTLDVQTFLTGLIKTGYTSKDMFRSIFIFILLEKGVRAYLIHYTHVPTSGQPKNGMRCVKTKNPVIIAYLFYLYLSVVSKCMTFKRV